MFFSLKKKGKKKEKKKKKKLDRHIHIIIIRSRLDRHIIIVHQDQNRPKFNERSKEVGVTSISCEAPKARQTRPSRPGTGVMSRPNGSEKPQNPLKTVHARHKTTKKKEKNPLPLIFTGSSALLNRLKQFQRLTI